MPSLGARWRALLLGVLALALAAALHGLFHALAPAGARPIPSLAVLPWVLASLGVAALLASAVTAGRRAKRGWGKLGVVCGHALLGMAGLAGVLTSDPAFPFGPHYADSLSRPDGRGTAYLYRGGLFCSQSVWRSEPGSAWAVRDEAVGRASCQAEGQLVWDAAQREVEIVGPDGRAVPRDDTWGRALDWRPH